MTRRRPDTRRVHAMSRSTFDRNFDREFNRTKRRIQAFGAIVLLFWLTVAGAIIFVAVHFLRKYW